MSNKRFPSGIMATCCIPWDENDRFAERIFRLNVQHALHGTKFLYVFGTAGEGYAVTDRQYEEIVSAFADEMRRGKSRADGWRHRSVPRHDHGSHQAGT